MKQVNISRYRKDNRSNEEFAQDIQYGNATEKEIIEKYKMKLEKESGGKIKIKDNGCGNAGELLSEESVTLDADFTINEQLLEVKFNKQHCTVFHIKESQLKSYIRQKAQILWVNGYTTKEPEYILLSVNQLKMIQKQNELVEFNGWGGKKARKLLKHQFDWKDF